MIVKTGTCAPSVDKGGKNPFILGEIPDRALPVARPGRSGVSLSDLVREAATGLKSLFVGLGITGKAFCQPQVTVIYPKQEVDNLATFRGHVELVGKEDDPAVPRCVACGACVKACPRHIIELRKKGPKNRRIYVSCVNKDRGAIASKACKAACIGCGKCLKECQFDAITIENNLSYIDFTKCRLCRKCESVCPTHAIVSTNFPQRKTVVETPKTNTDNSINKEETEVK